MFSQTPGFNYQALILNTTDIQIPGTDVTKNKTPLALEDVTFHFTITNEDGIEYTEEQTTTTDENGMISLIVGEGTPITSTFDKIDWDGKLKFLNVEIDILSNDEGLVFLDTQKILYIPQPSNNNNYNIKIVDNITQLTPPFKTGDLVWVKEYGSEEIPTLTIWDGENWVSVSDDYDPTNELGLVAVNDNSSRDTQFPNPVIGDQLWNQQCSCMEVFNGSTWVSIGTSETPNNFYNGLHRDKNSIKLGGPLIEPTTLTTSNANTLSIKGLEESNLTDDEIISIEKETGILRKKTASSLIKQEEVVFFALDGQVNFSTPIPISDPKKIAVYRNGVKIDFTAINAATIKLEQDAVCYKNDKIRIVQIH